MRIGDVSLIGGVKDFGDNFSNDTSAGAVGAIGAHAREVEDSKAPSSDSYGSNSNN